MPGEFYFMAIAGLGISFAGFAGVIAALDRRPSSAVSRWRIAYIVISGFILLFAGFGTVATYTVTGENLDATVRVSSLFLASVSAVRTYFASRPGPAWPSERGRKFTMATAWIGVGVQLLNVVIASLGFLQYIFLGQIFEPASIFINAVRDVARGDSVDDTDGSESAR